MSSGFKVWADNSIAATKELLATQDTDPEVLCFPGGSTHLAFGAGVVHAHLVAGLSCPEAVGGIGLGCLNAEVIARGLALTSLEEKQAHFQHFYRTVTEEAPFLLTDLLPSPAVIRGRRYEPTRESPPEAEDVAAADHREWLRRLVDVALDAPVALRDLPGWARRWGANKRRTCPRSLFRIVPVRLLWWSLRRAIQLKLPVPEREGVLAPTRAPSVRLWWRPWLWSHKLKVGMGLAGLGAAPGIGYLVGGGAGAWAGVPVLLAGGFGGLRLRACLRKRRAAARPLKKKQRDSSLARHLGLEPGPLHFQPLHRFERRLFPDQAPPSECRRAFAVPHLEWKKESSGKAGHLMRSIQVFHIGLAAPTGLVPLQEKDGRLIANAGMLWANPLPALFADPDSLPQRAVIRMPYGHWLRREGGTHPHPTWNLVETFARRCASTCVLTSTSRHATPGSPACWKR